VKIDEKSAVERAEPNKRLALVVLLRGVNVGVTRRSDPPRSPSN